MVLLWGPLRLGTCRQRNDWCSAETWCSLQALVESWTRRPDRRHWPHVDVWVRALSPNMGVCRTCMPCHDSAELQGCPMCITVSPFGFQAIQAGYRSVPWDMLSSSSKSTASHPVSFRAGCLGTDAVAHSIPASCSTSGYEPFLLLCY